MFPIAIWKAMGTTRLPYPMSSSPTGRMRLPPSTLHQKQPWLTPSTLSAANFTFFAQHWRRLLPPPRRFSQQQFPNPLLPAATRPPQSSSVHSLSGHPVRQWLFLRLFGGARSRVFDRRGLSAPPGMLGLPGGAPGGALSSTRRAGPLRPLAPRGEKGRRRRSKVIIINNLHQSPSSSSSSSYITHHTS